MIIPVFYDFIICAFVTSCHQTIALYIRLCNFLSPKHLRRRPLQLDQLMRGNWTGGTHFCQFLLSSYFSTCIYLYLHVCVCVQVYVLLIILWNSNRFFFVCHKWDPSWLIPDLSYWKSENRRQNYQRVQTLLSFKINHRNTKMPSKTHSNKISCRPAGLFQSSNHDDQARKALEQVKMRVNLWTGAPENGDLSFSWLMQFEPLNVTPTNVHNSAL